MMKTLQPYNPTTLQPYNLRHLLFCILILFPTLVSGQTFNLNWIDRDAQTKASQLAEIRSFKSTPSAVGLEYDLKFHRLLFTVDPAIRWIQGSVASYFTWNDNDHSVMTFDLSDSLEITAIRYHGALIENFTRAHNVLTIPIPESPNTPHLDSIMVDYQGVPPETGFGSFSLGEHNNVPVLYTLSEPYGASDWWPCKQNLNDKIDSVLIQVTTPPEYSAAANGMLVGELLCEDKHVMQWSHHHPIAAYLIGIAVTNYAVYSDYVPLENDDSIQILNYVYPETLAETQSKTPGIIEPFQLYNQLFGLYPFADERYGHAQWNWGGGMEHQTMSFMGGFGHDLMVHELAHQWFGDYITCGSWQDIWLNEGFATYLTGLTYEHLLGGIYWEPFKRLSIKRVMHEPGGSVFCRDTSDVNRIFDARLSYSKGAMVLHMLRWEIGDEVFFEALREYLHDPALAHGYAVTHDLMVHCEAAADTSLTEFFADWIYGEGYPLYEINYYQDENGRLDLSLFQDQSDPSVDFFEMDVPVRVWGREAQGNQNVTYRLKHTYSGQVYHLDPGFTVDSVQFDPDRWICTADPVVISGVEDIPLKPAIRVYPNPSSGFIHIQYTGIPDPLHLTIYDLNGRVVKKVERVEAMDTINLSELTPGVYVIELHNGAVIKKQCITIQQR